MAPLDPPSTLTLCELLKFLAVLKPSLHESFLTDSCARCLRAPGVQDLAAEGEPRSLEGHHSTQLAASYYTDYWGVRGVHGES